MSYKKYLNAKRYTRFAFHGFTLVELLIVISIIAILASIFLFTNVTSSLKKARDSKRKQDMNKLVRIFEDYYNDKQGYPYSSTGLINDTPWGSPIPSYVPLLPKDPLSPQRDYYYQTGPSAQNFFAIYAKLENTADPDIVSTGCDSGCGPNRAYNYVLHSPNVVMLAGLPNGEVPPDGGGGEGGDGGDGGGGGGGSPQPPSNTPGPATNTPSPTSGPAPPTPTRPPGAGCDYDQCCRADWCGGGAGLGVYCVTDEKCWYDPLWGWMCYFEPECP